MSNIKQFFAQPNVAAKFTELLGEKQGRSFVTNVLQIANNQPLLAKADPLTLFNAAATAATLQLSINPSIGHAYIVPFKGQAQLQVGYKGLIQLAWRSGQYKVIDAKPVYEGQYVVDDTFKGFHFDWAAKKSDVVIGYAAHFELINGATQTAYMTVNEVNTHAARYSQTAKSGYGVWKDNRDEMALKTVLKKLLKWGPLSVDMQTAVIADQGVIRDHETMDVDYVDNSEAPVDKVAERESLLSQIAEQ
jgi:recombination protein RecT